MVRKLKIIFLILIFQGMLLADSLYPIVNERGENASFSDFYVNDYHSISAIYISNDNRYVVSGTTEGHTQLWDIKNKSLIKSFKIDDKKIRSLSMSRDSKLIISIYQQYIKFQNIKDGNISKSIFYEYSIDKIIVSHNQNKTILAKDKYIEILDTDTQSKIFEKKVTDNKIKAISMSFDDRYMLILTEDKHIIVYDIEKMSIVKSLVYNKDIIAYAINPINYNAVLVKKNRIDFINLETGEKYRDSLVGVIAQGVTSVSLNKNGLIALGQIDGDIFVVDTNKDYKVQSIARNHYKKSANSNFIISLLLTQKQNFMITENIEHDNIIWDIENSRPLFQYPKKDNNITLISESEDKKILVVIRENKFIDLIDTQNKKIFKTIKYTQKINALSISQNSKQLLLNLKSSSVLLDIETEKEIKTFSSNKIIFPTELKEERKEKYYVFQKGYKLYQNRRGGIYLNRTDINRKTKRNKILVSGSSWAIFDLTNKKFFYGDDGTFLLKKDKYGFLKPLTPKSLSKKNSYKLKIDNNLSLNVLNDSYTKFDLNITNISDNNSTAYWIKTSKFDKYCTIREERIDRLKQGESKNLKLVVYSRLPYINPKPIKDYNLTLNIDTANRSKFNTTIPISIRYANIVAKSIELIEKDKSILNITLENRGNERLEKAKVSVLKPFESDIQEITNLEADKTKSISFVVPKDIKIDSNTTINLIISVDNGTDITPHEWHLNNIPIVKKSDWYIYAILILAILILLGLIFYFKRYRHPLVLNLTTNPKNLLELSYSELTEAKERLQKINQLSTTLAKTEVSQKILNNAIAFESKDEKEKIITIAQRVEADLIQQKEYYELRLAENFPLSVEVLIVKFLKSKTLIDIKEEIKQSRILEGKILLLLGDVELMRELYIAETSERTNMWVTLMPNDLTKLLLSSNPKEILATIISSQIALTQISPYQIGGGVNRESIFFGREKTISHILNKGVSNYIIIGGRQVGKSSLLKAIERRYKEIEGVECYYISASNENLIEDIKLELDQEELSDKAFARFINTSSKRYLFLIDEADDFVKYERLHNYSGLKFMRSLSEKNNASFILAGFWEIYRYTFFDYQSPLKNFASIFEVEELEYEACMDLTTKPMQSLGLGYENREDIEWMIQWLGQRANLIQIVCDYLVENIDPTQKRITKNDITNALQNEKLLKFFDDWNDMSTDNREKWIDRVVLYGTIERGEFDDAFLQGLISKYQLEINNNELDKSLVRLRLGYIIKKVKEGYIYRVPLFVENILKLNVDNRFFSSLHN